MELVDLAGRSGGRSRGLSGRGPRVPPPPWAREPPKPSKAEREQAKRAEARAERLHLAGLTNAAVIIMGVVLGAAVVMLVIGAGQPSLRAVRVFPVFHASLARTVGWAANGRLRSPAGSP